MLKMALNAIWHNGFTIWKMTSAGLPPSPYLWQKYLWQFGGLLWPTPLPEFRTNFWLILFFSMLLVKQILLVGFTKNQIRVKKMHNECHYLQKLRILTFMWLYCCLIHIINKIFGKWIWDIRFFHLPPLKPLS